MSARRNIFPFPAGGKTLYADPLVIYGRFMEAVQGDVGVLLERAYAPEGGAEAEPSGLQSLRAASRVQIGRAMLYALELPALNRETGEGFTAEEGEELYHLWMGWQDALRKKPDTSPTYSPATPATGAGDGGGEKVAARPNPAAPWKPQAPAVTPSSSASG